MVSVGVGCVCGASQRTNGTIRKSLLAPSKVMELRGSRDGIESGNNEPNDGEATSVDSKLLRDAVPSRGSEVSC